MNNTIAIIKVKGDMTLPIYLELTDDFKEAINNGCTEVIMDFSETNLIDSVGISFIIDIIKNTKIRKIKAIKANKMVTASLRAVNLLYILQQSED
jgi:anti-anti-sigma regulatory factor